MRFFSFVFLFFSCLFSSQGSAIFELLYSEANLSSISSRYLEFRELQGSKLFEALHEATGKGYQEHEYKEAKSFLYDRIDNVDGRVFTLYSGLFLEKTRDRYEENGDENGDGTPSDFVNCEHIWPQSKFNKIKPMVSDLHHLWPALSKPNGMRSSWPFGYVKDATYSTQSGSKLGYDIFEPRDEVKGNVARSLLYFLTRYYDRNIFVDTDQNEFLYSRIPMLIKWHQQDPPDEWEKARNDRIEAYQGNRNPYIDEPEFVNAIGAEVFLSARPEKAVSDQKKEEGLWDSFNYLEGGALFRALHNKTGEEYVAHSYDEAKTYLYNKVDALDSQSVRTVYSGIDARRKGAKFFEEGDANQDGATSDFVNCEHTWPQSKFDKIVPMVSDLHHLYSSYSKPNGMRGSLPFGYVSNPVYQTSAGSKSDQSVFEPRDEVKGNIARALLYFVLRYYNREIFMNTNRHEFWNSRIEMLLKWHEQDPPDEWEKQRNDQIEEFQGNRNPFIDRPDFLRKIGTQPFLQNF